MLRVTVSSKFMLTIQEHSDSMGKCFRLSSVWSGSIPGWGMCTNRRGIKSPSCERPSNYASTHPATRPVRKCPSSARSTIHLTPTAKNNHCAVCCTLATPSPPNTDDQLIPIFISPNYELLESLVAETNLSLLDSIDRMNERWGCFKAILLYIANSCVPLRRRRVIAK